MVLEQQGQYALHRSTSPGWVLLQHIGQRYFRRDTNPFHIQTTKLQLDWNSRNKLNLSRRNLRHTKPCSSAKHDRGHSASNVGYHADLDTGVLPPLILLFLSALRLMLVGRFPEYRPSGDKFSIWTESYGGHFGPVYADYFEKQNDLILSGDVLSPAIPLHLDTLGLVNACIDIDTQMSFYPEFAFNNTYGIQAINETQYQDAVASSAMCRNMTGVCLTTAEKYDPQGLGNKADVNKACLDAYLYCFAKMHDKFDPRVCFQ
jgi:hypothetical protein